MSDKSATPGPMSDGRREEPKAASKSLRTASSSAGDESELPSSPESLPPRENKTRRRTAGVIGTVWKALNTPFVLFLLSSVVVSVCSYWVATWRGADQQSRERLERVRVLDLEIKHRLEIHAARILATGLDAVQAGSTSFAMRVKAFYLLERPHLSEIPMTIVHELSGHALSSLLSELETLVTSTEEKEALRKALEAIQGLKTFSIIFASMIKEEVWEETLDLEDLNCDMAFRPAGVRQTQGQIEDTLCEAVAWFRDPGITAALNSLNLERWGKPFGRGSAGTFTSHLETQHTPEYAYRAGASLPPCLQTSVAVWPHYDSPCPGSSFQHLAG